MIDQVFILFCPGPNVNNLVLFYIYIHRYRTQEERSVPRVPSVVHYQPCAEGPRGNPLNTIVHLFRNGTVGRPAQKFVLTKRDIWDRWEQTLSLIAKIMDIPSGGICRSVPQ